MSATLINPPELAKPRGFSHAAVATGTLVTLAGQIGWDKDCKLVSSEFGPQFRQALDNLVVALRAAGGAPEQLTFVRIYVTDKRRYNAALKEIGEAWRALLGRHYPPMALLQISDLLEEGALVEIEALAVLS